MFDDPMDRYAYLIDIGRKLPPLPPEDQLDQYLVRGCQSKVWLIGKMEDDRLFLRADSNTAITKGIVSLLLQVLSGRTPKEIREAPLGFIDQIHLREHLSSQRANGLASMIAQIRAMASAPLEKTSGSPST